MRATVIVNPAARKGGAGRDWPEIRRRLEAHLGEVEVATTQAPGDATRLARAAVEAGADRIVAVGGDGTVNEALNGMMADDRLLRPDLVLCAIPAGTANELVRALGLDRDADAPYRAAASLDLRRIDLMRAECAGLDGAGPTVRYGYLICSYAIAATISRNTSRSRWLKKLGGRFSYYAVTILETLTYRRRLARIAVDDGPAETRRIFSSLICNAPNGGGGMLLAPGALLDDGMLDMVEFGDIARTEVLTRPPAWLFEGRHVGHPHVSVRKGARFAIEGADGLETLVDLDGETAGKLPLQVRVLPAALSVAVA